MAWCGLEDAVFWSVAAQRVGDRAGATNFDCYDPRDQICGLTEDEYEPQLDVLIQAGAIRQRTRVDVPQDQLEALERACRAAAADEDGEGASGSVGYGR